MIRPILSPEMIELLLRTFDEHPVWFYSFGVIFLLFIVGVVFLIVRDVRKHPDHSKEGGDQ